MQKKFTSIRYKCDYCDFESEDAKTTGKHEYSCEHRPESISEKIEKQRRIDKKNIYLSSNIEELNNNIKNYLKEYFPAMRQGFKGIKACKNTFNNFGYHLSDYTSTSDYFNNKFKISLDLVNYPKIASKLTRLKSIETGNVIKEYQKRFSNYREEKIDEYENNNSEIKSLYAKQSEIKDEIKKLQEQEMDLVNNITLLLRNKIEEIKNEYNFIDYSVEAKTIRIDLGIDL